MGALSAAIIRAMRRAAQAFVFACENKVTLIRDIGV
jgi:hypothetical protein